MLTGKLLIASPSDSGTAIINQTGWGVFPEGWQGLYVLNAMGIFEDGIAEAAPRWSGPN